MANDSQKLILGPISPAAPGPLYEQIVDSIKREISEGRIKPDTALPSFRALAEELVVSIITVKRAYEELEREGIIYRRQGLGTFVSAYGGERSRGAKIQAARELILQAIKEAKEAGLSKADFQSLVKDILEDSTAQ